MDLHGKSVNKILEFLFGTLPEGKIIIECLYTTIGASTMMHKQFSLDYGFMVVGRW